MNKSFIILSIFSLLAIVLTVVLIKRSEHYQMQNNAYNFLMTRDNNDTYRYNGEVPSFSESDFFG